MKIWLILEIVLASVSMAAFGSVYAQSSAQTATQQSAQSESKTAQDKPAQDKTDMWRMMQVVGHPDTTLHELDGSTMAKWPSPHIRCWCGSFKRSVSRLIKRRTKRSK